MAATARIRAAAFGTRTVLDEPDLSAVHLCAVELLQSSLHVRVLPELDHAFVPAAFVGVSVSHLPRLPHVVLQRNRSARDEPPAPGGKPSLHSCYFVIMHEQHVQHVHVAQPDTCHF